MSEHSVGEVARISGVTVRTLHHYDGIGLLRPNARTAAGYRRYGATDLDRLSQILGYRALGFSLEDIATLLDDPSIDQTEHLRRQHTLLRAQVQRLTGMVTAIERTLEAQTMHTPLTPAERLEIFGAAFDDHATEAEARWGDTEAWAQSARRTASYSAQDWRAIRAETGEIESRAAALLADGVAADSGPARALAETHREHLNRWYYDCGYEMHAGLGQMYVGDERFTAYYEAIASGLARWLADAIEANAAAHH